MYLFYPLPVTPHYVRYKRRTVNDNESKIVEAVISSEEEMPKNGRKRKESVKESTGDAVKQRTTSTGKENASISIWDILLYNQPLHQIPECTSIFFHTQVSLYHISDSMQRRKKLNNYYSLHMMQSCMEKTPCPIATGQKLYYDIKDIINLYQKFNIYTPFDSVDDIAFEKFFSSMNILASPHEVPDFLVAIWWKTVVYEIATIVEQTYNRSQIINNLCQRQRWLMLLSWFKLTTFEMTQAYHGFREVLSTNSSRGKKIYSQINEAAIRLQRALKDSNLNCKSAEFLAIQIYMNFKRSMPNFTTWCLSQSSKSSEDIFNQLATEDEEWIAFIVECGQLGISAVHSIAKILHSNFFALNLVDMIKGVLTKHIEDLFDNGTQVKNLKISHKIKLMVSNSINNIESAIESMKECKLWMKNSNYYFTIAVKIVKDLTHGIVLAIAKNAVWRNQLSRSNSDRAVDMVMDYISDIQRNGVNLAVEVHINNFVTQEFVLELCKPDFKLTNRAILIHNSAKVANSILQLFEAMSGSSKFEIGSNILMLDYHKYDFAAFLSELAQSVDNSAVCIELVFIEYYYHQKILQRTFYDAVRKALKPTTDLANAAATLLLKASQIGKY